MKKLDPDLKDAGEATQKDISDYSRYMLLSGGKEGKPGQAKFDATYLCTLRFFDFMLNMAFRIILLGRLKNH